MPEHSEITPEVDALVTRICNLGCRQVYQTIEALECGRKTRETEALSYRVCADVLSELKAVMSVYDARDDGPSCKTG